MTAAVAGLRLVGREARKLPAFVRRDFLVAWSYRLSFVSDLVSLAGLTAVFYFIGLMVDTSRLPTYGGTQVTYIEFAVVGLGLSLFIQLGLQRVAGAMRNEQLMGTLESLLLTPTSRATIQIGSIAFDLVYVPLRIGIFMAGIAVAFGLHFDASGIGPALAVLAAFVPFVWGAGVASAGAILTFRRGSGLVATGALALSLLSGVYFPIELLPAWAHGIAELNPVTIAVEGIREALLGGAGWHDLAGTIALLVPIGAASLALGMAAFQLALRRERRLGTLGLY